jgi:hypothetical protein
MFSSNVRKEMNRTNSLIILASITLGTFLVFNTAPLIDVSGSGDMLAQDYPPVQDYQPENGFNLDMQYNQDIYGEFSDQYESGYYEDHYGKPYEIK